MHISQHFYINNSSISKFVTHLRQIFLKEKSMSVNNAYAFWIFSQNLHSTFLNKLFNTI
ncbi:hypothetical protein KBC03_02640 [Patescibacteria group bacterium]|nr:hypothetical protein [Patescibacteria group bacterium]